jgi:hypothetical protein
VLRRVLGRGCAAKRPAIAPFAGSRLWQPSLIEFQACARAVERIFPISTNAFRRSEPGNISAGPNACAFSHNTPAPGALTSLWRLETATLAAAARSFSGGDELARHQLCTPHPARRQLVVEQNLRFASDLRSSANAVRDRRYRPRVHASLGRRKVATTGPSSHILLRSDASSGVTKRTGTPWGNADLRGVCCDDGGLPLADRSRFGLNPAEPIPVHLRLVKNRHHRPFLR